jgi:hypothetical protein
VPKNVAGAADWYRKAAAQGNDEARRKLVGLDADAKAGRAAEEAANVALRKALAAGKTTPQAWEEAALAAGRAVLDVELAAGRTQEVARQTAQQATDQVRARAPKVGTGEPGTITVEMSVAATPTNPPVIMGSTNLPDGAILSVYLLGDPPACVPDCGLQYNSATVQSGRFTTTLQGAHPLISDSYTIDVAMVASLQSQSVQSVIGKLGEHLRGPYVVTFGPKGQSVPVEFPRSNPSDNEKIVGYTIHYTQKIFVAGDASSDTASRTQAITDFREWNVKSCTSNIDFVNALVRSGTVTGSETLGAERQAKIDACTAEAEVKLQAALKSRQQSPAAMTNGQPQDHSGSQVASSADGQSSRQTGHEWMASAPGFCQSKPYGNLTPKQMAMCDEAAFRYLSKNWQTITAANGQAYEIALDTIYRNLPHNTDPRAELRAATVVVYISEGEIFKPNNVVHYYFDCHDHFQTDRPQWSPILYAPPLSVVAKIASIACGQ